MILIADSGSTKTDWRLSDGHTVHSFTSKGLNPYFNTSEQIIQELNNSGIGEYKHQVSAIHFYGAGLTVESVKESFGKCLHDFFKTDDISIHDDMLAAARALLGDGSGIACILGTGSNSCLYHKGTIIDKVPALGYVLGDEGSGAQIGIKFLNALHKRKLPKKLHEEIIINEQLELSVVMDKVYRQKLPNIYLASLTQLMNKYIEHIEIREIAKTSFKCFIEKNISSYKNFENYEIGFVGSIAYYFSEILKETLEEQWLRLGKIIKAPIKELINYHLRK